MSEKRIFLTADNRIRIRNKKDGMEVIDFNGLYRGYYPPCRFTAAEDFEGMLYLAGTEENGCPHLFSSPDGTVWTQVNIAVRFHVPRETEYGDILRILYEEKMRQLLLIARNGYLVVLPDCSKCVRARKITDLNLEDGWTEDGEILCLKTRESVIRYPLDLARQYRCAWTYAKAHVGKDGILLDLRDRREIREQPVPGAVSVQGEIPELFWERCPKTMYLFFLCERGMRADDAAREARERGYEKAYSLGGMGDIAMDMNEL